MERFISVPKLAYATKHAVLRGLAVCAIAIGLFIGITMFVNVNTAQATVGVGVKLNDGVWPYTQWIVNTVSRGDVVHRSMTACNRGTEITRIQFHAGEGIWEPAADGTLIPGKFLWRSRPDAWTTMAPSDSVLSPGQCQIVDVTITVPTDAPITMHPAVAWATTVPMNFTGISQAAGAGIREYIMVTQ